MQHFLYVLIAVFQDQKGDALMCKNHPWDLSLSSRHAHQGYRGARPFLMQDRQGQFLWAHSETLTGSPLSRSFSMGIGLFESCQLKSKRDSLWNIYSHFKVKQPQAEVTHKSWLCTGTLWELAHTTKFTAGKCESKLYVGKGSWLSSSGTLKLQILQPILQMILPKHIYNF